MTVALRLAEPAPRTSDPLTRMTAEVRAGLLARPRSLPSKYFYDDRGSELFEAITRLPEYYQTRTEESLLAAAADELIARAQPVELLELGSGAGRKVRLLLAAMRRHGRLRRLTLFDINASSVRAAAGRARAWDAALDVREAVGDFTADLSALGPGGGRLALLVGGTIGNLHPDAVPPFLQELAAHLAAGDHFLVGVDLVKDRARLEAAYNDAAGVTAEFNRNLLHHINWALDGDLDVAAFEHVAFWNARRRWIEMRLRATRPVRARIAAARLRVRLEAGDEIRTEISCKYTRRSFGARVRNTGFVIDRWLTDPEDLFALALLRRTA
jgi:L-histidine N-alpha-methyltransferase